MKAMDSSSLRIGAWRVDPALDQISKDGNTVKLERRAMQLLLSLAEHAGQVVSVEQLLDQVWAGVVVTPDSVYHAVAALRRTLGDDSHDPTYIANVPRRGYRLVARVAPWVEAPNVPIENSPSPVAGPAPAMFAVPNTSPPWRRVAIVISIVLVLALGYATVEKFWLSKPVKAEHPTAATMAAVNYKSIAVLPFVDMSEKKDQEYFADGMADEIISLLSRVPDLQVPARTSSFYFKGKSTKVPDIARELGVEHILEGSIRRSGNQIRVTAQLVRADNGYHLWSQTYDRDLSDVFKVQDDIANAVVQALQITLMGGPLTRQRGGTENLEAYQLYLRAMSAEMQNTRASVEAARTYLDQAVKLDPNFGHAWSLMAFSTMLSTDNGDLLPQDGFERARKLAQHALELSPDLAEAHFVLQYVHLEYDWDWAASEAEGRQAFSLDRTNTFALVSAGILARTLGHWDDAERQFREAHVRDPLNPFATWNLATTLYGAGRFADAEVLYRKTLEFAPGFLWTRAYLGKTLLAEGKPEAALATVQLENDEEMRLWYVPIILQANGRKDEADEALKTLIRRFAETDAYYVATIYASRGDKDAAFQWLDRAYKQRDSGLLEILGEPLFRNITSDPRYKALLRKMNLPQ